jgi:hypothetical protein
MGSWYWIGVLAGLGASLGVLCTGLLPYRVVVVAAAAIAGGIGVAVFGWDEAIGGLVGGVSGGLGAIPVLRGSLRRGGTRGGLAAIVTLAALALAALAFVPVLGYLEAVVLPAVALRLRAKEPERYAGLRTLARD